MATTAAQLLAELQTRLRIGTAQVAITDINMWAVMNSVQRAVNYALQRTVSTGTFKCASSITTINPISSTVVMDSSVCTYVLALYESTRSLMQLPSWKDISQYSLTWQTSGDARTEAWAMLGDDHVIVYPASTITYDCVYVTETAVINSSDDTFDLPDRDVNLVRELCELIWLVHLRHFEEAMSKAKRFKETLRIHRIYRDVSLTYKKVSV